ncbi:MAG: T9SS type A sorting domain-containing protein, partial [Luteibaculaceae bacterium]
MKFNLQRFSLILFYFGIAILGFYRGNAQSIVVTNESIIQTDFVFSLNASNTINSDCPFEFTVDIPEDSQIVGVSFNYTITGVLGTALTAQQRSYVTVKDSLTRRTPLQQGVGLSPGNLSYNINNSTLANGLSGTVVFQFHAFRTSGAPNECSSAQHRVEVGNFQATIVYAAPGDCNTPEALFFTELGPSSARVSWLGQTGDHEVSLGPAGHIPGTVDLFSVQNQTTILLTDLEPTTGYMAYTRRVCDEGTFSNWSAPVFFNTLPCQTPTNLSAFGSENTASVFWNSPALNFEISFGPVGHTPGTATLISVENAQTTVLSNLDPSTTYEIFIRSNCSSSVISPWSSGFIFNTLCDPLVFNLESPFFEGFEEDCIAWQFFNGSAVNQWHVGEAVANDGQKSCYISNDNGVTHQYGVNNFSVVHFFKDFEVPEGFTEISLTFNWKNQGQVIQDFIAVYIAPVNYTPVNLTSGVLPGSNSSLGLVRLTTLPLQGQSSWQTSTFQLSPNLQGQQFRLIFSWINNETSGSQPPGAIDNVEIVAQPQPAVDLRILQPNIPQQLCLTGNNLLGVRVLNYGTENINFEETPATFKILVNQGSETIQELETIVNTGIVLSGAEITVDVNYTPTQSGTFTYRSVVELPEDELPLNNGPSAALTRTVLPVFETPTEVNFTNYTGGNISTINPNWLSAQNFNLRSTATQETFFNGERTVRHLMQNGNITATILSPFLTIQENDILTFKAALTKSTTAAEADLLLSSDSIYVRVFSCSLLASETIWLVNSENNPLSNSLQTFTIPLNAYAGETIRLEFGARTNAGSTMNQIRQNDIHFSSFFVGQVISCPRPTALDWGLVTNEEGESCVQFSWEEGDADQFIFEVVWGEIGFNPQTEGNTIEIVFEGTSATICNIPSGVNLEFYVRANCGVDGFSFFEGPIPFLIPPPGESCTNPFIIQNLPFGVANQALANFGNNLSSTMATGLSCIGVGQGVSTALYLNGNDFIAQYSANETKVLEVRTSNLSIAFSSLFVLKNCFGNNPQCIVATANAGSQDRVLSFTAEEGETYFIIVSGQVSANNLVFDLSVSEIECLAPTGLTASFVDLTSAQISFNTLGGSAFEVKYAEPGFNPDFSGTQLLLSTGSTTIENLISGESYEFYVRQICDNSFFSDWSTPTIFQMPIVGSVCSFPIEIGSAPFQVNNVEAAPFGSFHNAAQINQTANCTADSFFMNGIEVVYSFTPSISGDYLVRSFNLQENNTALWVLDGCPGAGASCIGFQGRLNTTPRELVVNLEANETYTIIVSRAINQNFVFSLEIELLECSTPQNFTVTQNFNGFTLNWASSGNNFDVAYGPAGFNPDLEGTIENTPNLNFSLINLAEGAELSFFVRRNCDLVSSSWVGPIVSSVPIQGSLCENPISITLPAVGGTFLFQSFNTSNFGNFYNSSMLNASSCNTSQTPLMPFFLNSNEIVFSVIPEEDVEVEIRLEDIVGGNSSLFVFASCPSSNTSCVAAAANSGNLDRVIQVELLNGVEYFIMVSSSVSPNILADLRVTVLGITTSINEQIAGNGMFKVFPNPNNGAFSIIIAENAPNAHVEVFDLKGKLVYNKKVNIVANENFRVDLGNVSTGMYNIRVTTPNSVEFSRVMV